MEADALLAECTTAPGGADVAAEQTVEPSHAVETPTAAIEEQHEKEATDEDEASPKRPRRGAQPASVLNDPSRLGTPSGPPSGPPAEATIAPTAAATLATVDAAAAPQPAAAAPPTAASPPPIPPEAQLSGTASPASPTSRASPALVPPPRPPAHDETETQAMAVDGSEALADRPVGSTAAASSEAEAPAATAATVRAAARGTSAAIAAPGGAAVSLSPSKRRAGHAAPDAPSPPSAFTTGTLMAAPPIEAGAGTSASHALAAATASSGEGATQARLPAPPAQQPAPRPPKPPPRVADIEDMPKRCAAYPPSALASLCRTPLSHRQSAPPFLLWQPEALFGQGAAVRAELDAARRAAARRAAAHALPRPRLHDHARRGALAACPRPATPAAHASVLCICTVPASLCLPETAPPHARLMLYGRCFAERPPSAMAARSARAASMVACSACRRRRRRHRRSRSRRQTSCTSPLPSHPAPRRCRPLRRSSSCRCRCSRSTPRRNRRRHRRHHRHRHRSRMGQLPFRRTSEQEPMPRFRPPHR